MDGFSMIPMQQKTETRKGGIFEDVQRPWAQTLSLSLMHFARVISVLVAAWFWAKVWESYEPTTGKLSDLLTLAMLAVSLVYCCIAFVRIDDHFDADTKSRGIIALVCLVAMLAFNYAIAPVVVFSLVKIKTDLVYAVPVVVTVAAWAVFAYFKTGQYSFIQELTRQTPFNSEGYWIESLKQDFEREKRTLNADLQEALDAIDQLNARVAHLTSENQKLIANPVKEFAPYNHGNAKSLPIGARSFDADEQKRLAMWLNEWGKRGTSRDNWTTRDAEKLHGWRVSYPEWEKFTDALKGLRYLDEYNKPLLSADDIAARLHLPPCPTDISSGATGNGAKPDATRRDTGGVGG